MGSDFEKSQNGSCCYASDIKKKKVEEATERQIAKAVRDGRVAKFDFKGIASQATLGAKLPGRLQDISEQVLGNTRDKETALYLRAEVDSLLKEIGGENALLQKSISDATKGSLDEQIQAARNALNLEEQTVTKVLNQLTKLILVPSSLPSSSSSSSSSFSGSTSSTDTPRALS